VVQRVAQVDVELDFGHASFNDEIDANDATVLDRRGYNGLCSGAAISVPITISLPITVTIASVWWNGRSRPCGRARRWWWEESRAKNADAHVLFGGPRKQVGAAVAIGEFVYELSKEVVDERLLDAVVR
jgi:hypothetical protein